MKKIFYLIIFIALATGVQAQQQQQYTQFMFNKLAYNPGFAGSLSGTNFTAIVRSQWLGLDGAPQTQALSFSTALSNNRVGIGGNLVRNTIGVSEYITGNASYAYRVLMGSGYMGIGVEGSVQLLRNDYTKATPIRNDDGSIPVGRQSKTVPNFGLGAYYTSETFYVGLSAPRLLKNNIDLSDEQTVISREVPHIYAMGGVIFELNDQMDLQPQVLLKYVQGAPFDVDANVSVIFMDRFTVGLSYRMGGSKENSLGESMDFILAAQLSDNLLFGVSYDITLSDLKDYQSGSIEAALRYSFNQSTGSEYQNPRFF